MHNTSYKSYMSLFLNKYLGLALLCILALTSLSSKSIALSSSLYEAMVPVSSGIPTKPQSELLQEGFKLVLIQISGSEKTLAAPAVKHALETVDSYVTRYSYKDDAEKKRFLRVKFDENRVNELLRRINAPVLDQARPSTTVWIVVAREQDNPRWVSGESETELFQQLNADAKLRAIPLMFPLLDLADTEQVSEKTVWTDDFTALQTASKRYNADVLWIGKLSKQKSGWHGQWTLIANGKAQTWDNSNENLDHLSKDAMDELAKRLGHAMQVYEQRPFYMEDQYSVPDPTIMNPKGMPDKFKSRSQLSRFRLSVAGIKGIEEYTKLQEYLKTLPGVKEVEVSLVSPHQTIFDVVALSDRQTLINAIAEGRILLENKITAQSTTTDAVGLENTKDPIHTAESFMLPSSNELENNVNPIPNATIINPPIIPEAASADAADAELSAAVPVNTALENDGILNYKMASGVISE